MHSGPGPLFCGEVPRTFLGRNGQEFRHPALYGDGPTADGSRERRVISARIIGAPLLIHLSLFSHLTARALRSSPHGGPTGRQTLSARRARCRPRAGRLGTSARRCQATGARGTCLRTCACASAPRPERLLHTPAPSPALGAVPPASQSPRSPCCRTLRSSAPAPAEQIKRRAELRAEMASADQQVAGGGLGDDSADWAGGADAPLDVSGMSAECVVCRAEIAPSGEWVMAGDAAHCSVPRRPGGGRRARPALAHATSPARARRFAG